MATMDVVVAVATAATAYKLTDLWNDSNTCN